jgi:hypothetical protein
MIKQSFWSTVKLPEKDASIEGVSLDQAALAVPAASAQT